ncbi:MAG: hypothetical protein E3J56_02275 [Candidatus Aminicenantes bacterium]|nr:MAG: hypothetical protein E3J56_02275 [Candidatus Aminicenantes bacterium]
MKKTAILLAIVMVLGISLVAYAGATKYTLPAGSAATTTESGWVIVNTNPQMTILNFQVDGLPVGSGQQYWAYYKYPGVAPVVLGELKVNKKGSGHLNAHVPGGLSEAWVGGC